jgi:hypothetical protein
LINEYSSSLTSFRRLKEGPPDSDLTPKMSVAVAELAHLPLVLPSRPHGLRLLADSAASTAKVKLTVRFEADTFRVLNDLVAKGLGFTVLPLSAISREVKARRLKFDYLRCTHNHRRPVCSHPAPGMDHSLEPQETHHSARPGHDVSAHFSAHDDAAAAVTVSVASSCSSVTASPRYKLPRSLLLFQQRQQVVCCGALAQAWEDFVDAVLVRKGVQISHCIRNEYDVISMFVSMTGS